MVGNPLAPGQEEISLYFHIPFCTRKCSYCHFYVLPDKESMKDTLMEGFRLEWERWRDLISRHRVVTIYFGGGTPALFGPDRIQEILTWIPGSADAEVTLEANPENLDYRLARNYAAAGVNRCSIGIQTLDNPLLKKLGRIHEAARAVACVYAAREAGIQNLSVDLMYDLPGQTLPMWENTLRQVRDLPITHLSLYNLTIEPHTLFYKHRNQIRRELPDESVSLAMVECASELLEEANFEQYEISAFAKPGCRSRHNSGYWTGRPFLGFGPSGFSFIEGKRFRNIANLSRYTQSLREGRSPVDFEEMLDSTAARCELLVIGLRLTEGVELDAFQESYGPLDEETKVTLERLGQLGLMTITENRHRLTRKGVLCYDEIASELI